MKLAEGESPSCLQPLPHPPAPQQCWDNCFYSKTPHPWETVASVLKNKKKPHVICGGPRLVQISSAIQFPVQFLKEHNCEGNEPQHQGSFSTLQTQHLTHCYFIVLQFFSLSPFWSPSKRDLASSSTASSADLSLSSWGHTFSPWCPGCIVPPSPLYQHS